MPINVKRWTEARTERQTVSLIEANRAVRAGNETAAQRRMFFLVQVWRPMHDEIMLIRSEQLSVLVTEIRARANDTWAFTVTVQLGHVVDPCDTGEWALTIALSDAGITPWPNELLATRDVHCGAFAALHRTTLTSMDPEWPIQTLATFLELVLQLG